MGGPRDGAVQTGPGEQTQVDFAPLRVWIGDVEMAAHLFVFTLGYLRPGEAFPRRVGGRVR